MDKNLYEKKIVEVAKLCSDISISNNLDNFLLKETTAKTFSNIFLKSIVIEKNSDKKFVPFTSFPQKVGSFLFHIKDIFDLSELGEAKEVFESIAEIIIKKENDFKDNFTGLPNAQGFIQSLINSALDYNEAKATFIALKITHKNSNVNVEDKYIKEIVDEISSIKILSKEDIFARWSPEIFCFLIIPDSEYERAIKIQNAIRNHLIIYCKKRGIDINVNMGIHRLPKGSIEVDLDKKYNSSYQDIKMSEILNQSRFKEFISKTFKAMAKAMDTTFIVGTSVYKDIYTKEFIPISKRVSTETFLKNMKNI